MGSCYTQHHNQRLPAPTHLARTPKHPTTPPPPPRRRFQRPCPLGGARRRRFQQTREELAVKRRVGGGGAWDRSVRPRSRQWQPRPAARRAWRLRTEPPPPPSWLPAPAPPPPRPVTTHPRQRHISPSPFLTLSFPRLPLLSRSLLKPTRAPLQPTAPHGRQPRRHHASAPLSGPRPRSNFSSTRHRAKRTPIQTASATPPTCPRPALPPPPSAVRALPAASLCERMLQMPASPCQASPLAANSWRSMQGPLVSDARAPGVQVRRTSAPMPHCFLLISTQLIFAVGNCSQTPPRHQTVTLSQLAPS